MEFKTENSSSHVKDSQSEVHWIPATPAKPELSPIYATGEEKQSNLTVSELAGVSHETQQGMSFSNSSSCCVSSTNENSAEKTLYSAAKSQLNGSIDNTYIYNNFSIDNANKWNIPFQDLLAMADAAAGPKTGGRTTLVTQQCGQHNPSSQVFDLNSAPGTMSEADFPTSTPSRFAPVTPDRTRRLESEQISDLMSSIRDERINQEKGKENIENSLGSVTEKNSFNQEQPQLLQQSGDAVSMQLQENPISDKGANEEDANLNKTPQQKPRRRKHRPKVVIEGQPKRTRKPRTPKPDTPIQPPTGKRKYVRRKGIEKPEATPAEVNETNDPKTVGQTKKSCRRSLNFDADNQMNKGKSVCTNEETLGTVEPTVQFNQGMERTVESTIQLKQGMEATVEKIDTSIAYELTQSMNREIEGYLSVYTEKQANSPITPYKSDLVHTKSVNDAQSAAYRKGKCRIHFSDETHDRETNSIEIPNDLSCSFRGRKRQHMGEIGETEMYTNSVGAQYNSCQAYLPMFPDYGAHFPAMHFPVTYKKKRKEQGQHLTTSSILSSVPAVQGQFRNMATESVPSGSGCSFSKAQFIANAPDMLIVSGTQDQKQSSNCVLASDYTKQLKKKRTKSLSRVGNSASFTGNLGHEQWPTIPSGPALGAEKLAADTSIKLATKKRTKRNSSSASAPFSPLYDHQSTSNHTGFHPLLLWKSIAVDVLIQQLGHLDINAQSSDVINQEQQALIPYHTEFHDQNALVLYQRDGPLVPFDDSYNQIRRRKPRPKVDLDDETTRVWKLLLEDINSRGVDGTDEEKAKWWEEERKVFRGRADSFIARMHLVQGDRRFSRWKGSVVDSVVGVFLTQNVSDHLSSSAFMSLAARFPLKSEINNRQANGAETNISVREPEVSEVNLDETIRWHEDKPHQTANDQSSVTLQDAEYSEEKEVVNSNDFSQSSSINIASEDKLDCEALDMYHELAVNKTEARVSEPPASFMGDYKEVDDVLSSQNSVVSSQNSVDSSIIQNSERIASCSGSYFGAELAAMPVHEGSTFVELLHMQETTLHGVYDQESVRDSSKKIGPAMIEDKANSKVQNQALSTSCKPISPGMHLSDSESPIIDSFDILEEEKVISKVHKSYEEKCASEQSVLSAESAYQATVQEPKTNSPGEAKSCNSLCAEATETCFQSIAQSSKDNINQHVRKDDCGMQQFFDGPNLSGDISDITESTTTAPTKNDHNVNFASLNDQGSVHIKISGTNEGTSKAKRVGTGKAKQDTVQWDNLRQQARDKDGKTRGNTPNTMDSLDYEAVRSAHVDEIANAIKERGMNNKLAERIQDFLNRLVRDHGSIDLEWLRDVPPDKAKEYLLSFRGLGLKSVECVRLLTLHHLAFPVDTNVGRIAVRLGWVPLQPLPESLQLHLLELYPILESIQQFLWPRLCKLDQRTLYELHYQMITFGKVFCTKSKPNCNACPMRGECRHFASAFASARLSLPAPEDKSIVSATESKASDESPNGMISEQQLRLPAPPPPPPPTPPVNHHMGQQLVATNCEPVIEVPATPGPIIEVPNSPEQEQISNQEIDIEDGFGEDPDEIPTIKLNIEEFTQNLQNYMETNMELQDGAMSRALVAITQEAASIPTPKLKNVSRLRTEHHVYELPDSHILLKGLDTRERDDPCPYLLAIWTPGETADSMQPPDGQCCAQELGRLCDGETCFSCNSVREANAQTVRGTLLIPCRTAMRGSFPLNGTYFQVNEVFADHDSSLNPIDVPRSWLWNLPRRTVYFGTSIPTIFKGLTTEGIQYCFWRGFVCVRGFDQRTRAPRPLMARLHFPASRLTRTRGRME